MAIMLSSCCRINQLCGLLLAVRLFTNPAGWYAGYLTVGEFAPC